VLQAIKGYMYFDQYYLGGESDGAVRRTECRMRAITMSPTGIMIIRIAGCVDEGRLGEIERRVREMNEEAMAAFRIKLTVPLRRAEMCWRLNGIEMVSRISEGLKKVGEKRLGNGVENTLISVPLSFDHSQRDEITETARMSGLKVPQVLSETPSAAL
jgi:hypothetical protein